MLLFQNKLRSFTSAFLFFLFLSARLVAQVPANPVKESTAVPLFFLDGKEILQSEMTNISPDDIAMVTVLKKDTFQKYGEKGKNGVILIQSKVRCRQLFQQYLSGKSAEYKKILSDDSNDQNVQYVLNEKVLKDNYEGDLASIADSTFISINVIGTKELKAYEVTDKKYGVVIKTKVQDKPVQEEVQQSKFEPELLVISIGKVSFDPSASKSIEKKNEELKEKIRQIKQTDPSKIEEENSRLMMESSLKYIKNLNFFGQIAILSQNFLTYRFIERFPNTLILLKDTVAENGLTDLAKIAQNEKMPYVLSFPSAHIAKENGQFVLHLKVQLYEAESNSIVLDKDYTGDQSNPGFEFSCDGSIQCVINNALSGALADVVRQISSNNKTLQAEGALVRKRAEVIEKEIFLKNTDPSLIKSVVTELDSTVNLSNMYQTFYNDDKSKFVGFFFRKVGKQDMKGLADSKKDMNVKILSGADIKDKNALDIPPNYAYIVKGVLSDGKWHYKKDMVTYFEADNENDGRLKYLNNLQSWGYFKDALTEVDPDFWDGEFFEDIEE